MKMVGQFEETKAAKMLSFWFRASIFLFLIGMLIWSHFGSSERERMLKEDLAEQFNGRVDSLYRDERNHNVKIAVLSKGWLFSLYPQWEPKVEVGDSLAKSSGSLKIYLYKKGKEPIVLDYKETLPDE